MRLKADGWGVSGWNRDSLFLDEGWDLFLCCLGRVAPVGHWHEQGAEFARCLESNLVLPLALLRETWATRRAGGAVCFLAGSNPQKIMPGYLAYNTAKMALLKAVEQIDAESPDCKIFALGPGYVPTKIHRATLEANWPNERIARGDAGMPLERIYECLKWCLAQPKEVVGGRNICASDPFGVALATRLRENVSLYKLRRAQ